VKREQPACTTISEPSGVTRMNGPFLALITPIGAAPGEPTHPIAPGGPTPMPPIYYPPSGGGQPPGIWPSPGHPTHPIAPGGQPPGIWPSPGHPAHPIAPGGPPAQPTHPIVIPPDSVAPGVPTHPIYLPVYPAHPIVIPSPGEPPIAPPNFEVRVGWTAETGWVAVLVPTGTAPQPSK
jgi:hypothetical protein